MSHEWELGKGDGGDMSSVDLLDHSLKLLADETRVLSSNETLAERAIRLSEARMRLNGIIATTIGDADRAGVATDAGLRTMAQFLASRSHLAPETVRADLRIGKWVGSFSQLENAMLEGAISRVHIDTVRKLDNIRVTYALLRDQHLFVEWAQHLEWKTFKDACAYWLMVNDQDGVSRFARTSLLALGGQNAQQLPHNPTSLTTIQSGNEAREVTMSISTDPSGSLGETENAASHAPLPNDEHKPSRISSTEAPAAAQQPPNH